jgi:hypothetical protein
MQLEKKTYVHHYGMLKVEYACQVETNWARKIEKNGSIKLQVLKYSFNERIN